MIIKEYDLSVSTKIVLRDSTEILVVRYDTGHKANNLVLQSLVGTRLELESSVDISEQLSHSRLFTIESEKSSLFMLFGGEFIYWLRSDCSIQKTLAINKIYVDAEYWVTEFIGVHDVQLVVYEGGVLALDGNLDVLWHINKFFNDVVISAQQGKVTLLRDHAQEWTVELSNGNIVYKV